MDGDLEFRRQLYKISTRLSTDDVSNMKFYCTDDYLPRRQLEAVQSGFHLFCLLLDKGTLSKENTGLLKELLELVHKRDLFQLLCGRPLQESHESTIRSELLTDPIFKSLLKELGDSLPQKQLKDVVFFFSGSALTVQDAEDLKKPEEIFQKLKDSRMQVDTLVMVLDVIGRQDLCEKVRKRCSTVQASTEIAPAGAMTSTGAMISAGAMTYTHPAAMASNREECSKPIEEQSGRPDTSPGSLRSHDRICTSPVPPDPATMFYSQTSNQFSDGPYRAQGGGIEMEVQTLKAKEQVLQDKIREEIQAEQTEVANLRETLVKNGDVALYQMDCTPHGIALIIVNEHFRSSHGSEGLQHRSGAAVDRLNFCELFESLGYIVEVHYDLKSSDMLTEVQKVANRNHGKYDSFVLCVSTHGTETTLYGTDSRRVNRNDLFAPVKKCETLREKPKMFFIQACRMAESGPLEPCTPGVVESDGPKIRHVDTDCFYANATTSLNPAYRNTALGSWFVTNLRRVFLAKMATHTLTSMMHHVNAMLQEEVGEVGEVGEIFSIPPAEFSTTCTKDIRFSNVAENVRCFVTSTCT